MSIQHDGNHKCSGAVVSARGVVTAARCIPSDIDSLTIRAKSSRRENQGVVHAVERYVKHPNFTNEEVPLNDLAVVFVDKPFEFDSACQPVKLARSFNAGWELTVTGYGLTGNGFSEVLKSVVVYYVNEKVSRALFGKELGDGRFSAVGINSQGKIASQEDRGGPAILNRQYLIGILSYIKSYKIPIKPEVYTKIPYYYDWLNELIAE